MAVSLTDDVRQQYQALFNSCVINPGRQAMVNSIIARIMPNQARYQSVAQPLGIPWFFVALVHNLECSLNFNEHLHNGDPLTARTVHVPAGRPPTGDPPFTWEQSATDALTFQGFANKTDWTLPAILYRLEAYNGFGYRAQTPPVNTPYLWGFSNQYTSGKYVADHVFDPNAVSAQCGSAVLLFQMAQNGAVSFAAAAAAGASGDAASAPAPAATPTMSASDLAAQFDNTVTFGVKSDAATSLQNALNTFPGISVGVDGDPGRQTSDAYNQVTGHFLKGDPLS
jgi:lysozyme family protein